MFTIQYYWKKGNSAFIEKLKRIGKDIATCNGEAGVILVKLSCQNRFFTHGLKQVYFVSDLSIF